jgi:hypothetical protein
VQITNFHAKYFAYELTKRCASDNWRSSQLPSPMRRLIPRLSQAPHVRSRQGAVWTKHFEAIALPFAVAINADEV